MILLTCSAVSTPRTFSTTTKSEAIKTMRNKRHHYENSLLLLMTFIVILFGTFGIALLTILREASK